LMDISLAILDGEIGYTKALADIVYHCTLCGACDVMCKRTLETERLPVIEELRKGRNPVVQGHRAISERLWRPREKAVSVVR
jgi:L-lactate utilization protein LutB